MEAQNTVSKKRSSFILLAPLIFVLLSGAIFNLLQNPSVYNATVNKFGFSYIRINNPDGSRKDILKKKDAPYQKITKEKLTHWDAFIYKNLSESFYQKDRRDLYAFFPLFPFIWKLTHASNEMIVYINLILFLTGYFIFYFIIRDHFQLSKSQTYFTYLLLLAIPTLTIFSIPYAEAVTFMIFSFGLYFLLKKKLIPAFIFFILLAWCRPNTLMLLIAAFASFVLYAYKARKTGNIKIPLLTVVAGLFIGLMILFTYYFTASGNFWIFFEAQKNWGTQLQWPKLPFTDYAGEVFPINQILLFAIAPISLLKLIHLFFIEKTETNHWYYVRLYANIYFLLTSLTVLFFQGGSLHSLHRYILATPLGLIFIVDLFKPLYNESKKRKWMWFTVFVLWCGLILHLFEHRFLIGMLKNNEDQIFMNLGFIIFMGILSLLFWLPKEKSGWNKVFGILVGIILLLAIFWDTVLFNVFLSRGWLWA